MINLRKITFLTIALISGIGSFRGTCGAASNGKGLFDFGLQKASQSIERAAVGVKDFTGKAEPVVKQIEITAHKLDQTIDKISPKAQELIDAATTFFYLASICLILWVFKSFVVPIVLYLARRVAKSITQKQKYVYEIEGSEEEHLKKRVSRSKKARKSNSPQ